MIFALALCAAALLPNGDFSQARDGQPVGWKPSSALGWLYLPSGGEGGRPAIGVEGVGTNNCKWCAAGVTVEPNRLYGFSAKVKAAPAGGLLTMGTPSVNVSDRASGTKGAWVEERRIVVTQDKSAPYAETFRLGEYLLSGRILFSDARLTPLRTVYAERDGLVLGHGEKLTGNVYSFSTRFGSSARVHARPFHSYRAAFNTSAWAFSRGDAIVYRHELAGRSIVSAKALFTCGVRAPGSDAKIVVEASSDGRSWRTIGSQVDVRPMGVEYEVPSDLLPAKALWVRIGGERGFRLNAYHLTATVDGAPAHLSGETTYVDETDGSAYLHEGVGAEDGEFSCGELIGRTGSAAVWTASSGWKIPRHRAEPVRTTDAVRVKTAANEAEAVQLCVSAAADLADVRVTVEGDAVAKKWLFLEAGRIPASAIEVGRVAYVRVRRTSDYLGRVGPQNDPIEPQDARPLALAKGETQPFWIRVKAPKGTPKGVYRTALRVETRPGETSVVPLEIEVFGFELPDRMTCKAPFGYGARTVWRFQRLKTPEDRRWAHETYFQALSDYHITPYELTEARISVSWTADRQPVFDWTAWDAGVSEALEKYHFNGIRLGRAEMGIGGGDEAHSVPGRVPGSQVKEGDPDYEPMLGRYLKGLEAHLREKGWLDLAYVYSFDEPRPGADPLVMKAFGLIKRHAPGIRLMLTAPMRDSLVGGPDIWCPIAPDLHGDNEAKCRARGDEFWWYCCMCPTAPYLSLFIDHPGVELRTWLWQTWGEGLTGALIWSTNYWTSDLMYPDKAHPQNCWEDTVSWSPRYWAERTNGDGRLFYPPRACFDGGTGPVREKPVPTRRLEMLRDGFEDYEYFVLLRKRNPQSPLLKVPSDVYSSLTAYNYDPAALEAHREKLARAIEGTVP